MVLYVCAVLGRLLMFGLQIYTGERQSGWEQDQQQNRNENKKKRETNEMNGMKSRYAAVARQKGKKS
jgi:hypothetical protein